MVEDEQLTQTQQQDEQIENAILDGTKDVAQNTIEKTADATKQAIDKATRQARDAAKQATKKAARMAVKAIGQAIVSLISALLPYIAALAVVVALFAGIVYFLEIETAKDTTKNIYDSMGIVETEGDIADIVEIVSDSDGYHLEFIEGFDDKLEEAIKNLNKENKSINLSDKETLKKFIMAEAKTKFPYLQGEEDGTDKFQGSIIIKRYTPDKNIGELGEASSKEPVTLKYVDEETFQSYINSADSKALDVYTLDENKNLLTATWSYSGDSGTTMQSNSPMDYRSATARYTMPFEYPLFFLIDSDCPEFCVRLAELAMNSTMEIAIIDNVTDTKTVTTVVTTTNETKDIYDVKNGRPTFNKSETTTTTETSSTEVITESVYTSIQVANVESWATKKDCEIKLNSTSQAGTPVTTNSSSPGISQQLVTNTSTKREYVTTGQSIATTITTETYQNSYDVTDSEVEENTENFEKIYKEYEDTLRNNMIPDWLFEIMEENPKTVNMIDLTKYLLYKATGKDYGVKNFEDISFGDMVDISTGIVSNDILFDYIASQENGNMLMYMKGKPVSSYSSDVYLHDYITEDKKYYICGTDYGMGNGTRNFGFGVCHYNPEYGWNTDNIKFYSEEGFNIKQDQYLQLGTKLEVELVDNVKRRILNFHIDKINEKAQKQGVTLQINEIHAIVDLTYVNGPYGNHADIVIENYKKYGNTEQLRNACSGYFSGSTRANNRWKLFHEGKYITSYGELNPNDYIVSVGGVNTSNVYFNVNLYNSDGSVNQSAINELNNKVMTFAYSSQRFSIPGINPLQCTWWANGRASQFLAQYGTKYNEYPTRQGNGGDYWGINQSNHFFEYGNEPRPNSLLCYAPSSTMSSYGHVTYVEAVDYVNKKIYISHCSSGERCNGITELDWDGRLWGDLPQGYIYLAPKTSNTSETSVAGNGYSKTFTSPSGRTFKLYDQNNYANTPYWGGNVKDYGCGPSSAAIILSGYGKNDSPDVVARSYAANGRWGNDGECKFFHDRGLKSYNEGVNWEKAKAHLKAGNVMVASISAGSTGNTVKLGDYAYSEHFVTFLAIDGDKIYIGDPGKTNRSGWYKISYLQQQGGFAQFFYVSQ